MNIPMKYEDVVARLCGIITAGAGTKKIAV